MRALRTSTTVAAPQWTVKGSVGRGFKARSLKQIAPDYREDEGPNTYFGNASTTPGQPLQPVPDLTRVSAYAARDLGHGLELSAGVDNLTAAAAGRRIAPVHRCRVAAHLARYAARSLVTQTGPWR